MRNSAGCCFTIKKLIYVTDMLNIFEFSRVYKNVDS